MRRKRRPFSHPVRNRREHQINDEIRAKEVRIVEIDGEKANDVLTRSQALDLAETRELDLILISKQANPPVCKIMEYSKFAYDLKKKRKQQKSNQHQVVMKEIRFGPNTDDHDLDFKTKHAEKFLTSGNKLKAYVQFRGRNIIYKDRGRELLERFADRLSEHAQIESAPKMNGKRMIMIMAPK